MTQGGVVSLAIIAVALLFSRFGDQILHNQTVQVLAMTLGSILAVAVAAAILIYIPERVNRDHRSNHRRRGRSRHRNNRRNKINNEKDQSSKEEYKQNETKASSNFKSQSCEVSSRKKNPSMPPLRSQTRNTPVVNSRTTTSLLPIPGKQNQKRRYSSPPSLLLPKSNSQQSLNPIVERKLEDLTDYNELYWAQLDSRTQYYALILGYTPETWDDDFELDDLICEDWDWDEMTSEEKAAAMHFGYNEETWDS